MKNIQQIEAALAQQAERELRDAELANLKAQVKVMREALDEAKLIIKDYARQNPKWWNPAAEKGMTQSVPQDPMGAHAWLGKHADASHLERIAALSAPAKEGEK